MSRDKVWIDLTNSPHVLFFRPILRRLDEAGVPSVITARDYAQTLGLLELYGMAHPGAGADLPSSTQRRFAGCLHRLGLIPRKTCRLKCWSLALRRKVAIERSLSGAQPESDVIRVRVGLARA